MSDRQAIKKLFCCFSPCQRCLWDVSNLHSGVNYEIHAKVNHLSRVFFIVIWLISSSFDKWNNIYHISVNHSSAQEERNMLGEVLQILLIIRHALLL